MGSTLAWSLLAIAVITVPTAKCGFYCPDAGWLEWGGSCYIFSIPSEDRSRYSNGSGYQNAASVCKGIGGHLLVLDSLEEAEFAVGRITASADAFLWCTTSGDGQQATCGGADERYYNSATDNSGFWDWASGFPRSSTSPQCVVLRTKQPPTLITSFCGISYTYACEKTATFDGITTEEPTTTAEPQVTADPQVDRSCQQSSIFVRGATGGRAASDTCLINHVIEVRGVRNPVSCAASCSKNALCRSFNFYRSDGKCELNSFGMGNVEEHDLLAHSGCVYYEID